MDAPLLNSQQPMTELGSILTPWLPLVETESLDPALAGDPEKHRLFQHLALKLVQERCPWLLQLVTAASGQICAMQGSLLVVIPAGSSNWVEIPELSAELNLLPWREDDQACN